MIYRFDEFELDLGLFELRKAGTVCELKQKGFDLLHYMLRHAGTAVTKEELYAAFWKEEHVHQSTLPVHIRTIRKALGQSAALIQTVRGVGYQITCPVEVVGGAGQCRWACEPSEATTEAATRKEERFLE